MKMPFINGRSDKQALLRKIGSEAPPGDFQGLLIDSLLFSS